jgi:hypothetical protein
VRRLLLASVLIACVDSTAPIADWRFDGLMPYADYKDPSQLRVLWQQVEACSGLAGDFDAVTFYSARTITRNGKPMGGAWLADGNRIVLAQGIFSLENERTLIRHEEMHALVRAPGHPAHFFREVCGDLMDYDQSSDDASH